MSNDYVSEKLSVAIDCLATSSAPLQQRLADASASALVRLESSDFANDPQAAEVFGEIKAAMGRLRDSQDGAIEASARAMDDLEAERVAQLIRELHGRYMPL